MLPPTPFHLPPYTLSSSCSYSEPLHLGTSSHPSHLCCVTAGSTTSPRSSAPSVRLSLGDHFHHPLSHLKINKLSQSHILFQLHFSAPFTENSSKILVQTCRLHFLSSHFTLKPLSSHHSVIKVTCQGHQCPHQCQIQQFLLSPHLTVCQLHLTLWFTGLLGSLNSFPPTLMAILPQSQFLPQPRAPYSDRFSFLPSLAPFMISSA